MSKSIRLLVGTLTVSVFACGDAGRSEQQVPEEERAADTRAQPAAPEDSIRMGVPAPRDPTRRPGSVGTIMESEIVVATLSGESIELSRDTVPAGEVTVIVENKASAPCDFEVTSQFSGRWRAPVGPGRTVQIGMVLSRSPYHLFCAPGGATAPPSPDTIRLIVR